MKGTTLLEKTNNLYCFYPQFITFEYLDNQIEKLNLTKFLRFSILKCLENNKSRLALVENTSTPESISIIFSIDKTIIYCSEVNLISNESTIKDLRPSMKVLSLL